MQELFQPFFISQLLSQLSSQLFIPHGHCYLWKPELVTLHLMSDVLIGLAYYSIPITLVYFVRKRQDLPFNSIFLLFGAFIVACGTTHFLEVWTLWHPTYWLAGFIKAITAVVSVYTAIMLVFLLPKALDLPSLAVTNQKLENEIAERQKTEVALRASEERLRLALDAGRMGTWEWDIQTGNVHWDATQYELCGLDRNSTPLNSESFLNMVHPEDLARLKLSLSNILAGKNQYEAEFRILCPDEKIRWLAGKGDVIRGSDGEPLRLIGVNFDITERKQSEEALRKAKGELELRVAERTAELISVNEQLHAELRERRRVEEELRVSQARFAGILEIADDAVISIDGNQQITLFNQGAEKIFGYTAQEAIGKSLDVLLPMRFMQTHRQHVVDFAQSSNGARRMGERREIYGRRKNGEEFPAEASISKLQLRGETIFTVILRDISARHVIDRMKDEFISVVSHELRTPLTSIHGSLGMLASGLLDAEPETEKRLLEIAVDSTERLVRLINDVLDVERIESGKVTMAKQACDVADLMTNAADVMQAMAEKFNVTLMIFPLYMNVWADPDRIIQMLTNLLSNAIKFSPAGTTVQLSAALHTDEDEKPDEDNWEEENTSGSMHVLFKVSDQGRGIPADKLETIFERFQQVDASDSRNHDGTGLGLAICRTIVQQHGGRIWVESILGEGSTFYFTLPIHNLDHPYSDYL